MNFIDRKLFTSDPPVCMAATTEELEYNQLQLLIANKSGSITNFNPFSRTSVLFNEDVSSYFPFLRCVLRFIYHYHCFISIVHSMQ